MTARAALILAVVAMTTAIEARAQTPADVRLTLDDAVQRAVEHNPDLAIVRLDTEVEAALVGEARGAYAPVWSTTLGRSRNVTPFIQAAPFTTGARGDRGGRSVPVAILVAVESAAIVTRV